MSLHDSAFVNSIAGRLLVLENHTINTFEGNLEDYKLSRQKTQVKVKSETEEIMLKMKIAQTVAKFSSPNADKDALELEYQSLIAELNGRS